ncbi:mandelate racemase/muconate lactonizing enzyme family protein [Pseudoponticoccus marisrubri]|uniref:Mandelate racemase/muconate lactonizing enzyme C-terminal domain-containing protein n=1 Tax=Pseudoponticoccus marisrubri TaxID=1685382 RepID=A0A0W7WHQ7_9RHOB|nr:mandelate racemase/muconate lactonizing enzyme family protein [Pseudoponticoccus marisrubri]KUF10156.1 hypothetical protein AVJ23_13990 [Pseudoponticoccus marisrubri]
MQDPDIRPLARIEAQVFRVPLDRAVETSFGAMRDRPAVFVRLEDDEGAFGWGEVFANWPAAGAEHRARLLVLDLADLLIGQRFADRHAPFHDLTARTRIRALQGREWGPFDQVIAGLDIAFHDLLARRAGLGLARFLNPDAPDSVPTYASGIHVRGAADTIAACRAAGHDAFKIKVGFDLPADIRATLSLVDGLAAGERLFTDANQGWDVPQAIRFAEAVGEAPPGWIEEPIPADAPPGDWARVAAASRAPLAGGENIAGRDGFDAAIASGLFGVLQPDIVKWGGLTGCGPVARAALDRGLTYCPHYLGGGIGLLASAALLAATGGPGLLEVDVNPNPLRVAFDPFPDGTAQNRLILPDRPGLGITELPESLAPHRTLQASATHKGVQMG